jgi:hypothetical protein
MQAGERLPGGRPQALRENAHHRTLDGESRKGVTAWPRREPKLGVEVLLQVVPAEPEGRFNRGDDDHPFSAGASQEPRRAATGHLPASAFGEAAPVGANRRVLGPPVGEVVRFGDEPPDIVWAREQLSLRLNSHRLGLSRFRHDPVTHACGFPRYRQIGEEATGTWAASSAKANELEEAYAEQVDQLP